MYQLLLKTICNNNYENKLFQWVLKKSNAEYDSWDQSFKSLGQEPKTEIDAYLRRFEMTEYLDDEKWAKNNQLGMWQGKFIRPEEWRRKTK